MVITMRIKKASQKTNSNKKSIHTIKKTSIWYRIYKLLNKCSVQIAKARFVKLMTVLSPSECPLRSLLPDLTSLFRHQNTLFCRYISVKLVSRTQNNFLCWDALMIFSSQFGDFVGHSANPRGIHVPVTRNNMKGAFSCQVGCNL